MRHARDTPQTQPCTMATYPPHAYHKQYKADAVQVCGIGLSLKVLKVKRKYGGGALAKQFTLSSATNLAAMIVMFSAASIAASSTLWPPRRPWLHTNADVALTACMAPHRQVTSRALQCQGVVHSELPGDERTRTPVTSISLVQDSLKRSMN